MQGKTVHQNEKFSSQRRLARAIRTTGNLTKLKKSRKNLINTLSALSPTDQRQDITTQTNNRLTIQSTRSQEEEMKVKELRNWLSDFGEKNKKHYNHANIRLQDKGENDDLLIIQSKPSTAATSPTSSRDGSSPRGDESLHPSIFCDHSEITFHSDHEDSESDLLTSTDTAPSFSSSHTARSGGGPIRNFFVTSQSSPRRSSNDVKATATDAQSRSAATKPEETTVSSKRNSTEENSERLHLTNDNDSSSASSKNQPNDEFVSITPSPSCDESHDCQLKMNPSAERTKSAQDETQVEDELPQVVTESSWNSQSYDGIIKMTPSADPTTTTQDETEVADELPQVVTKSWDSEACGSWWSEEQFSEATFAHCEPYDEFDSSSLEDTGRLSEPRALGEQPKDYSRRNTFGGIQGLDNMGHEHETLLRKQAPILTCTNHEENDATPELSIKGLPTDVKMHNADLFNNKTLSSSTLDFICFGKDSVKKSKWSSSNTIDSSDDGTNSSWSHDSSKPSIAPGALESKMGRIFLQDSSTNSEEENWWPQKHESETEARDSDQPIARKVLRKKLDPKDLSFLQPQAKPAKKVEETEQKRRSSVSSGVLKFGGPRKTIVERRKDQLQKLWAESKSATHVKKIQWGVCQKTGSYKKKVVIDVQYK